VESVFGQIKGALGLDRFRLRAHGERERGMGADGHHPQHPQAVQGVNGHGLRAWFMSPRLQSGIPESQELNHRFLASAQRATRS